MEYSIIRHISTIKKWSTTVLELNIIKWADNPEKYDLRRWKNNTPGRRGLTLSVDELRNLYTAIGEELKYLEDVEGEDEYILSGEDFDFDLNEDDLL